MPLPCKQTCISSLDSGQPCSSFLDPSIRSVLRHTLSQVLAWQKSLSFWKFASGGGGKIEHQAQQPGHGLEMSLIISESWCFPSVWENGLSKHSTRPIEMVSKRRLYNHPPHIIFRSRTREVCLQLNFARCQISSSPVRGAKARPPSSGSPRCLGSTHSCS